MGISNKTKVANGKLFSNFLFSSLKTVGEAISPISSESIRLGKNGAESLHEAAAEFVESVKGAAKSGAEEIKRVVDNPAVIGETAESLKRKALGSVSRANGYLVDAYEHRNELINQAKTSTKTITDDAFGKLKYYTENPRELLEDTRQLGNEIISNSNTIKDGVLEGVIGSAQGIYGHLDIGKGDFTRLMDRISLQCAEYKSLTGSSLCPIDHSNERSEILDSILVGGDSMVSALTRKIPNDILKAYSLEFPNKSLDVSFKEYVGSLTDDNRTMFVSKIKGKLFEIDYVEELNDHLLPSGYHAELAQSATQPAWDIYISGPDEYHEYLQLKATSSVQYVKDALETYPDIHVVTTSEVYSELMMHGYQNEVIDGGISLESLSSHAIHGVETAEAGYSGPSLISMALIAFTSYQRSNLTIDQKNKLMGDRLGTYATAYFAGIAADCATGGALTYAQVVAATFSRLVISSGRKKIDVREQLTRLVHSNEIVLSRLRARKVMQLKT